LFALLLERNLPALRGSTTNVRTRLVFSASPPEYNFFRIGFPNSYQLNAGRSENQQSCAAYGTITRELLRDDFMTRKLFLPIVLALLGVFIPVWGLAQSDNSEPSLGDLARQYRKGKAALEHAVIDNDNLRQVMDEVQTRKLEGKLLFGIDGSGKKFQVSSPDVTCDLSFSGSATSLLSDPYAPRDLPEGEMAKLDGPATISGDTLQVSVHNGTTWNIREITVGVTIVRSSEATTTRRGSARLIPAAETTTLLSEKQPDSTVLYHLKGSAAPSSTTVFHETLGTTLGGDQEWHWAIVQAKGVPSQPAQSKAP